MKPKSAIQKGRDLENYVSDQLIEKKLDTQACRSKGSGSGTGEKSDIWTKLQILGRNAGIECKHQSNINLHDWWRQTKKLEKLGREPVLVYKHTNDQYKDTKAVLYLDTLLDIILLSKVDNEIDTRQEDWQRKDASYKIDTAIKILQGVKNKMNK